MPERRWREKLQKYSYTIVINIKQVLFKLPGCKVWLEPLNRSCHIAQKEHSISFLLSHLALNKLLLVRRNHQADCTEETIAATVNELQQVLHTKKKKTVFSTNSRLHALATMYVTPTRWSQKKKKKKWWEQGSHTNWSIITETTGTSSFMKFASTKFNTGD